ncbi:MAG: DUF4147 domain-containing protein, partial [Anaerolineales bacterium]|nr:DUF4147 domain-containing protein [Anaerolineales bacterium]
MSYVERLHSCTLDGHPHSAAIKRILSAALDAADPAAAVRRHLWREGSLLRVNKREYALNKISAVYLVAVGKAAISMAEAARDILGAKLTSGLVVVKQRYATHLPASMEILEAAHPVPDERSLAAGRKIFTLLEKTTADDLVVFLISGGGSALMTVPVAGISLADTKRLISRLLGCGARIDEINTLRRALDQAKGGGLAQAAAPAQTISLLLSDVVASPLEAIASGPTVANPTSRADALAVLEKYALLSKVSPVIRALLQTPAADDRPSFPNGNVLLVGSNLVSASAARVQAEREGLFAKILTTSLQGEAALAGRGLADVLRQRTIRPICLIAGGETTVTLSNASGLGGRNQEVALAAVGPLAGLAEVMLVTLATD